MNIKPDHNQPANPRNRDAGLFSYGPTPASSKNTDPLLSFEYGGCWSRPFQPVFPASVSGFPERRPCSCRIVSIAANSLACTQALGNEMPVTKGIRPTFSRPIVLCSKRFRTASIGCATGTCPDFASQIVRRQCAPRTSATANYTGAPCRDGGVASPDHSKDRSWQSEYSPDHGYSLSTRSALSLGKSFGETINCFPSAPICLDSPARIPQNKCCHWVPAVGRLHTSFLKTEVVERGTRHYGAYSLVLIK